MKVTNGLYVLRIIALFMLYLLGGKLGAFLNAAGDYTALFWPALGIGLAAVLLYGYRMWPAIFAASFILPLFKDTTVTGSLLIAFANTVDILVCAFILKYFLRFSNVFSRINDVIGFAFVAVPVAAAVGATLGTAGFVIGGRLTSIPPNVLWERWWASDVLSYVIVTPLLLSWHAVPHIVYNKSKIGEMFVLLIFALYCGLFTFTNIFIRSGPMTFMAFPPVIWAALRFGQKITSTIVFSFCVVAVWSTIHGFGPFVGESTGETLSYVQSFMSILAVTSLMLAALIEERNLFEKRKDEFISIASHELKTPLTSIKAFVQIIPRVIKEKENRKALQYLKNTDEQLDKLTHLVNDLLNLSKIQSGKLELRQESFSLAKLVDETVKTLQASTSKHTIMVKNKTTQNIYADREKIGQVLINLLSNAIKYSPKANKIIVTLRQKRNVIEVAVQDFGIGIPPNKLDRIFNRFYQVQKAGHATFAGFGLGLYISSEIIKLHHGKIWAESEEGKGSTFSFTLPMRPGANL